jgi:hypothetical protein
MITATKNVYSNQYNKIALKTFIRGLPPQLQSIVRLRNPDSLEHAMTYVTEEENFRYTQNFAALLNNNQRASPSNSIRTHPRQMPTPSNAYCPSYPTHPQPFSATNESYINSSQLPRQSTPPQFLRSPTAPRFPRQPINVIPTNRPPQQRFFSNTQVFGKPRNVFQPTGQQPNNRPEPMSTTSRNPTVKHPYNTHNNYFKPTGQRNFISEEIHFVQNNEDEQDSVTDNSNNYDNEYLINTGEDPEETNNYQTNNIQQNYQNTNDTDYLYSSQTNDNENFPEANFYNNLT